jgi:hypothetical protein
MIGQAAVPGSTLEHWKALKLSNSVDDAFTYQWKNKAVNYSVCCSDLYKSADADWLTFSRIPHSVVPALNSPLPAWFPHFSFEFTVTVLIPSFFLWIHRYRPDSVIPPLNSPLQSWFRHSSFEFNVTVLLPSFFLWIHRNRPDSFIPPLNSPLPSWFRHYSFEFTVTVLIPLLLLWIHRYRPDSFTPPLNSPLPSWFLYSSFEFTFTSRLSYHLMHHDV